MNPTQKKLADFYKEKASVSTRFKTALKFLEGIQPNEVHAATEFLEKDCEAVFGVLLERLKKAETSDKTKKKDKDYEKVLMNILSLLRMFFTYLPNHMKRKWQSQNIYRVLERYLHKSNKLVIRLAGVEHLMVYINLMRTGVDEFIKMYSESINLTPLYTLASLPATAKIPAPRAVADDPSALSPSLMEASVDDACAMWDKILAYAGQFEGPDFEYWWELVKEKHISYLYAGVSRELGIKIENSHPFEKCPSPLQRGLINALEKWFEVPSNSALLWNPKNALLMMEFSRKSYMLMVRDYNATVKKSIDLFKHVLLNPQMYGRLIGEQNAQLQNYWKMYIKGLSEVFLSPSTGEDDLVHHHTLCKEVLGVYTLFAADFGKKMRTDVWDILQMTILETTFTLLRRSNPNGDALANVVADELMNKLYLLWIMSTTTSEELWAAFKEKLTGLLEWKAVVTQWKEKMIQLTAVLNEIFYRGPNDPPKASQPKGHVTVRDTKISSLPWEEESIKLIWFTMLHFTDNLNRILEPTNFSIAMAGLSEMVDMLLKSEEKLNAQDQPPIPLYQIFLPTLLEACSLDDKRVKGKLIAYTTVCKLFCRDHVYKLDSKFLAHFYRALQHGMTSGNSSIVWVILQAASNIFCLPLPGASVLIPDFLREIDQLFRFDNKMPPPEAVQHKALQVLASLLCFPSHYQGLNSLNFPELEMRSRMASTLISALAYKQLAIPRNKTYCIWLLANLALEEMLTSARASLVFDLIRALILDMPNSNDDVARNASDAVATIAIFGEQIEKIDSSVPISVAEALSDAITGMLERAESEPGYALRETVVVQHINALQQWLLVTQTPLQTLSTVDKIFTAIEYALLGDTIAFEESASAVPPPDPKQAPKKKKAPKTGVSPAQLFAALKAAPAHKSTVIREAAEMFLVTLMSQHTNFPSLVGPEQLVSRRNTEKGAGTVLGSSEEVPADEEQRTVHFLYQHNVVYSLCQLPKDPTTLRVTVRDATGKYTWDFKMVYEHNKQAAKQLETKRAAIVKQRAEANSKKAAAPAPSKLGKMLQGAPPAPKRPAGQPPVYSSTDSLSTTTDQLDDLIDYMKHQYNTQIGQHFHILEHNPRYDGDLAFLGDVMERQVRAEADASAEAQRTAETRRVPMPLQPLPAEMSHKSFLHHVRLFLGQLGLLTPEYRSNLHFIDLCDRYRRQLNAIDKLNSREIVKVAILYVKPGQDDQKQILRNTTRSKLYSDFVKGLGWNVALRGHTGYQGGLERDGTAGLTAPYYATADYEMAFHELTRMPTPENDEKQVLKKKHVGNDAVTIVWSENKADFKRETITSHFNHVHVVIYPQPTGLFRIQLLQKENIPLFGPAVDGLMCSKRLLPYVVRQTALLSNRLIRNSKEGYVPPIVHRQRLIKEVYDKFRLEKTFEEYMAYFFTLNPPEPTKPVAGAAVASEVTADGDA